MSGSCFLLVFGLLLSDFTFDFDTHTGIFGFATKEYALYVFLVVGLFTGATYYITYIISLNYFSTLVVASTYLLEPVLAQILGCLMNIDRTPGIITIAGATISLIGLLLISFGGYKLQKELSSSAPIVQDNEKLAQQTQLIECK